MPRLTSATPKYRHHRASGQALVTITGVDRYLGPWKSKASRIEYDRLIGEWLAAGRPTTVQAAPEAITVAEVVNAFRKHAERFYRKHGRSTGTAENYKSVLSLLRRHYGHTLAVEFGPLALKALRLKMVEADASRRYVNDQVQRVRKIFRWAASEQLVPHSIAATLDTVDGLRKGHGEARETEPTTPVDDATVETTLAHLPAVVADMVRLQRLTGARPGEICSMRPCDIDRTGDVWKYVPAEHKTEHHGKRRLVCIGPKGQAILRPYLLRDSEACCFSPKESEKRRRQQQHDARATPLSCGNVPGSNRKRGAKQRPNGHYTNDSYRRAIQRGCEVAFGMPAHLRVIPTKRYDRERGQWVTVSDAEREELHRQAAAWRAEHCWSPHRLRHAAATDIRRRFGIECAQVTLGHSRMDVTEIYAAKNEELAATVAREVG